MRTPTSWIVVTCWAFAASQQDATSQEGVFEDSSTLLQLPTHISKDDSEDRCGFSVFYGLSTQATSNEDLTFRPQCVDGQCGLKMPSGWSRFTNGKLPEILPAMKIRELYHEGDRLFNPAIIPLPKHLHQVFPDGRWLAVFTIATDQSTLKEGENPWPPQGSLLAVFDRDFSSLAQTTIAMRNGGDSKQELSDHHTSDPQYKEIERRLIADARMLDLGDGSILLGFTPYSLTQLPSALNETQDWTCHEFFAKLHIAFPAENAGSDNLSAWVDRHEIRMLDWSAASTGFYKPPHLICAKNLGFMGQKGGKVQALFSIYPTSVVPVDLASMDPAQMNRSAYITSLQIEPQSSGLNGKEPLPWHGALQWNRGKVQEAELNNGPALIWIEEIQAYLGVGHFRRARGDADGGCFFSSANHHYTNIFFTVSSEPPFRLRSVGAAEFCPPSSTRASDCDSLHFLSALVREDDLLHVGYGAFDRRSFVATISLAAVLESLQALHA
eukprot:gnl/TRDRNA2_/TRDRNA2_130503_c0_seq1.p1 gnl/TRDRNA2_/TRDRNA2_130503_c0~~gnl/TRDRNA2_/TRDRNA2_130503_c0_seq1.p1  ORF type:complete len:497 (-),score=50.37 gnl/TRDRNA2_/TRDRNA2_130503_c0_seq1:180-1670(-)